MKITTKKHRRGNRKGSKNVAKSLRFLGVNAAGIKSKQMAFEKVLDDLKPGVFFIEETKLKDSGKLKFENYIIFEKVRKNRDGGGGLAIGCLKDLHPVWIREGIDPVETLSINIFIQNKKNKMLCCLWLPRV